MTDLLWWQSSPSPFSIFWYCFYGYLAHRLGLSWTDSAWLTGFSVLIGDMFWLLFSIARWAWWVDTASILQATLALFRDVAGIIMFYTLLNKLFGSKLGWNQTVNKWVILNVGFLLFWFTLAPSIAWTDWTYAITHDFALPTVVGSFLLSHFVGRIFVAQILRSWILK
jgi:hypothetical protein